MMSLPPTTLLTLCLLVATLLGVGIGACLWQLRSAARLERALGAVRHEHEAEREALGTILTEERERAVLQITEAREALDGVRSRHDALADHAREQSRRIDALEAEILAYETRHVKLQRDLASDRAGRRQTAEAARAAAARRDDRDLPVLNRRVGVEVGGERSTRPASGSASGRSPGTRFPLGENLDIPTLSESELPEDADDPELDLLDTRNLFIDTDDP